MGPLPAPQGAVLLSKDLHDRPLFAKSSIDNGEVDFGKQAPGPASPAPSGP